MTIDIYMLRKNKIYGDIYDITDEYDYSSIQLLTNPQKDFTCGDCGNKTVYITNENKCPSCSYKKHTLRCDYCCRNISCVSCGGKTGEMLEIDRKVFCRNNRCLMSFGYFINYKGSKCVCDITGKLDLYRDLQKYVGKFLPKATTCWNLKRKLPDLTYSDETDCTHCHLNKKYRDLSYKRKEKALRVTCNCY